MWHVAASLETLRSQLNAMFPNRNKAADGGIGDEEHASRSSDHNPWYRNTVTARDFTHDPRGGLDGTWLANQLVASRDVRIKYIIWNRRIWENGSWTAYHGENPHTHHVHLSVKADASCESTRSWKLAGGPVVAKPTPPGGVLSVGSTGPEVKRVQELLNRRYPGYSKLITDGEYGPATASVVREFQSRSRLQVDGKVGPATRLALGL